MTTILIQGAAGFVAQTLIPMLIQNGFNHLILVDRKPLPLKLIDSLRLSNTKLECFINSNLLDLSLENDPDIIISLAGMTDVDKALKDPKFAFESNTSIAINLGEWLRLRYPKARAIYLSSDEVLGESCDPLPETAPLHPTQPYAASKAAAETVLHNYRDVYQLNMITLRSCNLIGSNQRARKLIPITIKNILLNQPIPIYGDGRAQREWMAVEDLCIAIIHLMDSNICAGIYQAATGTHLTIEQVIEIISDALDISIAKINVNDRLVHDQCYAMTTAKLRSTGWKPSINPVAAIRNAAFEMCRDNLLEEFVFES